MKHRGQFAVAILVGSAIGTTLAMIGTPRPLVYLGLAVAYAIKLRLEASR